MDGPDSGELRGIYEEHASALGRYALLLTGNRARAAYVVRETVLRARREPQVADSAAPSARAWLFTVARNMIIDEQRSAGLSNEIGAPDSAWPDHAAPEEVNAAVDRLLLGDALAQLPADHRAAVRCAYYQGCTTAQIAADLHIAEETVKSRLHDALRELGLQLREMRVAPQ
ncbi:sigma-70 family RNA polymerase sigma factor [Mycolicibacterium moriokaense]|uniref:RNA polymerase sigma-70 factor (ECF subfamily) n=1 Tax=Mycolicibacterium moriokaense TaxID=39691 RepID=A0A318H4Y7_9MYCO|nr:sigma-70 family RNA polymerase sigma factor [Mycolicibacterium moriokaense]PXW96286.1 RNA polymerase sigma-70 factor (ECF subfamily) [Mycolicibacterium moriokaense]